MKKRHDPSKCLHLAHMWDDLLRLNICSKPFGDAMRWYWLLRWAGAPK